MKFLLMAICLFFVYSCSKVRPGYVGVKVYLLGGEKGVDHEELGVGRYWIGINEELYRFPVFLQNVVWKNEDRSGPMNNEAFVFQTKEGMSVGANIGLSYRIDPEKVSQVFQKYRKGIDEITETFLRNHIRNALNEKGARLAIDDVYGPGKAGLLKEVTRAVKDEVEPTGILIDKIYLIGGFRLPDTVTEALNAKIKATQMAAQRKNEIEQTKAEAQKRIEKARGEAQAILQVAKAKSKANHIISRSLTPALINYNKIEKWNGTLPKVTGSQSNLISIGIDK